MTKKYNSSVGTFVKAEIPTFMDLHQQALDKLGRGPLRRSSDLHGEEGMPGVATKKGGWGPPVLEATGLS